MAKKIAVFGAGLVGSAIARDLASSGHSVTAIDINNEALQKLSAGNNISIIEADFSSGETVTKLLDGMDLAVGASPGAYGFELMKNVIMSGKSMVDISFCPEDFMALDGLAREKGVTVVADMGVAPGTCNLILGYHDSRMKVSRYKCIVGGLPVKREWPFEYKSTWSPRDCIEEYIRPARVRRAGQLLELPAVSELELVEIEPVGQLEEWNSDGLRSLLYTLDHVPDMTEKTLRYPGTTKYMLALRETGLFSEKPVNVNGELIAPIDLTSRLLIDKWKLDEGEEEYTVMRIVIDGIDGKETVQVQYDLYDKYNVDTATTSMARTTGYACTGIAELILNGTITEPGVLAPEIIGRSEEVYQGLLGYLKERGVEYRMRDERREKREEMR